MARPTGVPVYFRLDFCHDGGVFVMRWGPGSLLITAALLAGCATMPRIIPPQQDNPANPQASAGPAIPAADFLNVDDAARQIAQPQVTAGRNLPMPGSPLHGAAGHTHAMGGRMSKMKMNMKMNMMKMKMDMPGHTGAASKGGDQ